MEYVLGFWLVGVVFTSLYICAVMYHRRSIKVLSLSVGEAIATGIFTCLAWPAFLVYTIHAKYNTRINLRNLYQKVRSNDSRKRNKN